MTGRALLGVLLATLLGAAGCRDDAAARPPESRPTVVCTVGMVGDVVRAVAGDRAQVVTLMGAGVDPHLYKPAASDIARLTSADLVFYNGLLLEGKMTDALLRVAGAGRRVVALADAIPEPERLEPEQFQGHYDPHIWMDPRLFARTVDVARDALGELDPAGASAYRTRAAAYREELAALDAYAERVLGTVPPESRVLITAHDAFNYFGRRYGYEVVGLQGISTESEASVRDVEQLVALVVSRGVRAVFVESTVTPRGVEALIAGAKSRGKTVALGGQLFSDAMGKPGTYEGTYIGMIDHNVTTIARALGGEAPPGGMHGKLAAAAE